MNKFKSKIKLIGVNPYVSIPDKILKKIFLQAGVDKGPIPIHGTINNIPYKQTLLKYSGEWRLYINNVMLKGSPKRIGELISIGVDFDPVPRKIKIHPMFAKALKANKEAKKAFDNLSPSRQKEIIRYISFLKSEESVRRNIDRAIRFLTGNGKFVGRDNIIKVNR